MFPIAGMYGPVYSHVTSSDAVRKMSEEGSWVTSPELPGLGRHWPLSMAWGGGWAKSLVIGISRNVR